jgi:hypothetical protein
LHETASAGDESPSVGSGTNAPPLPVGSFPPAGPYSESTSTVSPSPAATAILANGDSLTVTLSAANLRLKTDWGVATIDTSHARSVIFTDDTGDSAHEWQQIDGRWQLHRLEDAPAEAPADADLKSDSSTTVPPRELAPLALPRLEDVPTDSAPTNTDTNGAPANEAPQFQPT